MVEAGDYALADAISDFWFKATGNDLHLNSLYGMPDYYGHYLHYANSMINDIIDSTPDHPNAKKIFINFWWSDTDGGFRYNFHQDGTYPDVQINYDVYNAFINNFAV